MRHRFSATRRNRCNSRPRDMDSYSVQCDRTGFRANASDCVMEWNGKLVLESVSEERNAQEFIRVPREDTSVPHARPRNTDKTVVQSDPPDWDSY